MDEYWDGLKAVSSGDELVAERVCVTVELRVFLKVVDLAASLVSW